ncbi:UvrABC system protein B [subsurface metagenome]
MLLGVTGSGKTFSIAKVIEKANKPVLVISHNKTLAAQLYQEFKEFFPNNAVHYFVSYYDYYQPEAYIPQTDTYIEKDAKINEEIDRLRHAATQDLLTRKDVIVVASVSCIYNIGSPETYQKVALQVKPGQKIKRRDLIARLTSLQYQRNDIDFRPGTFRVRGDIIEVYLVTGEKVITIELSGDKIVKPECRIFPAHFWITPQDKLEIALENIKLELQEQLKTLKEEKKLIEAQKLEKRTNYDLELIKETGFCHGIENYSRHLEFRKPKEPSFVLLNYFPKDFLTIIDESHMTLPQLHAMYNTDKSRKEVLIEYGFRLPSALDNRPLNFKEFEERINQTIYVSATPGPYEKQKAREYIVEQLIRPTGLLEPSIEIKPTKNQVKDLIGELKKRIQKNQRSLVITLTKRLSEALTDYLKEAGIKTHYLHSEIKTLERPKILQDLREGKYDVIVGINLLREGLDLPEVSLIAILDADKEGFLRNETTLIQTMGRAARHSQGHVIMYADKKTLSMDKAIKEVLHRRNIQEKYNKKHKITPKAITKEIREWPFAPKEKEVGIEFWAIQDKKLLEKEMKVATKSLDFERAAEIRNLIKKIKGK